MATIPPILTTSSPLRTSSTLLSSPPSPPISLTRISTTLGVAGSSSTLRVSTSESSSRVVVETTVGRSTTTVRPTSPTTTSTRIPSTDRTSSTTSSSFTRLSSTSITSTPSSVSPSSSTRITTVSPSATSSTSSSAVGSSIVNRNSASASSSAGASNAGGSGLSLGTGAIAAIATSLTLVLLALLLIGYRYYSRKQRQRRRASSRFSAAYYGGSKAEGGNGEGEKEVTPYRIGFAEDEGGGEYGGGDAGDSGRGGKVYGAGSGYSGYPPQPPPQRYSAYQEPRLDVYGQPISHSDGIEPAYAPYSTPKQGAKNLPVLPMNFNPGTPNTFGSFGSAQMQEVVPNPLAVARERELSDGKKVWVRQGFVRSLDDELVIAPGDELILVQAYDDGWSLCENMNNGERGVVPLNCLETSTAGKMAHREEMLSVPGAEDGSRPGMSRSSTTASLALSDRSQRRSSLYQNAQAAGMYLQQRGQSPGR